MPLIQGKSKKAMSKNIETEMHAGKPQKQSIAIAYSIARKNKRKKMAKGGEVDSADNSDTPESEHMAKGRDESRGMDGDEATTESKANVDNASKSESQKMVKDRKPKSQAGDGWTDDTWSSQASESKNAKDTEVDEDFVSEKRTDTTKAKTGEEMAMKGESTDPMHIDADHDEDIKDAKYAKGGYIKNFHDEGEANTMNADTEEEMAMKGSSSDPFHIDADHAKDIADAKYAKGGKIMKQGNPKLQEAHKEMHPSDLMTDDERAGSIADMIMAKKKKMAEGGQVDLSENADEEPNHEDDLSFEALKKENYSETAGLDELDSPMDSNLDSRTLSDEDEHGKSLVDKIRAKMKAKRGE